MGAWQTKSCQILWGTENVCATLTGVGVGCEGVGVAVLYASQFLIQQPARGKELQLFIWFSTLQCGCFGRGSVSYSEPTDQKVVT